MQLTFLGTGTSTGVPVVACSCPVCTSLDPRNRRMRTSALLRTADQTILIDAGPDFRHQALAARIHALDAVLLTHSHFDHVAGLDDLRPLTAQRQALPVFGDSRTLNDIRKRFDYAFAASSDGSSRPALQLHEIQGPFQIGSCDIIPITVIHGTWTITGYRIGDMGYITDASSIPASSLHYLRDLDVLVLNALRFEPHPTHLTIAEATAIIADLRPRRAFLVHMTHAVDHASVDASLPNGISLAYDGLELDIAEHR